MYAVTVLFEIKPGQMETFLPLMIENAETSLKEEPGCRQFDVCTDPNRPGEVFLYELYSDEAAFKTHLETKHFKTFDVTSLPMITHKTVKTYEKVAS